MDNKFIEFFIKDYGIWSSYACNKKSKLAYIGYQLFEFTIIPDHIIIEYLTLRMLEVLKVILYNGVYAYIQNPFNYINFITMINTLFLHNKLNWLSSTCIEEVCFNKDNYYECKSSHCKIEKGDILKFIHALLYWTNNS